LHPYLMPWKEKMTTDLANQLPNRDVVMFCADLNACPDYLPPPGYDLRLYRPGDAQQWVTIQQQADKFNEISPALFWRQFGDDEAMLAESQFYLQQPDGDVVGTATAWQAPWQNGDEIGLVHWVAILPGWQGRGLAKPLLSAVCRRFQTRGMGQAWLSTSLPRLPALNLYWHFGFRPVMRSAGDVQSWELVLPLMKHAA
jgi:GNAT superfamily N-acetyltransferase